MTKKNLTTAIKIAEIVKTFAEEQDLCEDTALSILIAAAGYPCSLPTYLGIDDTKEDVAKEYEGDEGDEPDAEEDWEDDSEDGDEAEIAATEEVTIGKGNRVVVPASIIKSAEENLGYKLNSKKYHGKFTVDRNTKSGEILITFGDVTYENEDEPDHKVTLNALNAQGRMQFTAAPVFKEDDVVDVNAMSDGTITIW